MNHFANTLGQLRQERGWTQTELADRSAVPQSRISSYENGGVPEHGALERLVASFEGDGVLLVIAYLNDAIPPSLIRMLDIRPRTGSLTISEPAPTAYSTLAPSARRVVDMVAVECGRVKGFPEALEGWMVMLERHNQG